MSTRNVARTTTYNCRRSDRGLRHTGRLSRTGVALSRVDTHRKPRSHFSHMTLRSDISQLHKRLGFHRTYIHLVHNHFLCSRSYRYNSVGCLDTLHTKRPSLYIESSIDEISNHLNALGVFVTDTAISTLK